VLDPLDGTPSDTFDLHGYRASEAAVAFEHYLAQCRQRSPGALLHIITGKGLNSPRGPVLKSVIRKAIKTDEGRRIAAWSKDDDDGGFLVRLTR
jgi:DNA-nicking Smr family endonuclease